LLLQEKNLGIFSPLGEAMAYIRFYVISTRSQLKDPRLESIAKATMGAQTILCLRTNLNDALALDE